MRRVLITGSRDWPQPELVEAILNAELGNHGPVTVVHGAARGVDSFASQWVTDARRRGRGALQEAHPAEWRPHGIYNAGAGPQRNQKMVDLGADVCYAFIYRGSSGATHCANRAAAAGIPVVRIEIY